MAVHNFVLRTSHTAVHLADFPIFCYDFNCNAICNHVESTTVFTFM